MKKFCILMGSPRKNGNTMALLEPFIEELTLHGAEHELVWLYDKKISPCTACRCCQKDWSDFNCAYQDDMQEIERHVMARDIIVLATPIYSCYCTAPMKAAMDRLVYGLNKYYGEGKGPSLWAGKKIALISTCGYPLEKGVDLWEEGVKRYCKHSQLGYGGMIAERHSNYNEGFMDLHKEQHAREFANLLLKEKS